MRVTVIYSIIGILVLLTCSCDRKEPKVRPEDVSTVYICDGGSSKRYHSTDKCSGLSNCSGEVIQVDKKSCSESRTPCKICFDTSNDNYSQDDENLNDTGNRNKREYYYLDRQNVLHNTLDCRVLNGFLDDKIQEYAIRFIQPKDLKYIQFWYCSRCFTDKEYTETLSVEYNTYNDNGYICADSIPVQY